MIFLECPECGKREIENQPWHGMSDETFLKLTCRNCGEKGFFQLNFGQRNNKSVQASLKVSERILFDLQKDWRNWHKLKKHHLGYFPNSEPKRLGISWLLLLFVILSGWGFFYIDQIHLLKGFFENQASRQKIIQSYVKKLGELPCLSEAMKAKLLNVPILYTLERPYHLNFIQYGEGGIYWGKEQIKIYRSNFWFIGLPKVSQLVETLIHELRHRVSPDLGHSALFKELVARETWCALENW